MRSARACRVGPPAARTASATREPGARLTTPGRATSPTTCTRSGVDPADPDASPDGPASGVRTSVPAADGAAEVAPVCATPAPAAAAGTAAGGAGVVSQATAHQAAAATSSTVTASRAGRHRSTGPRGGVRSHRDAACGLAVSTSGTAEGAGSGAKAGGSS